MEEEEEEGMEETDQKLDVGDAPEIPVLIRAQQAPSTKEAEKNKDKENNEEEEEEISVYIRSDSPQRKSRQVDSSKLVSKSQPQAITPKKPVPRTTSWGTDPRGDERELLSFEEDSPLALNHPESGARNHKYLSSPFGKNTKEPCTVSPIVFSPANTEEKETSPKDVEPGGDELVKKSKQSDKSEGNNDLMSELKRSNTLQFQKTPTAEKDVSKRKQVQTQIHRQSMIMDEDMKKLRKSSMLTGGPLKDEDLEEFVEAIVKGQKEVAHSVDPSDITEMKSRLGAGACGTVFK